MSIAKYNIFCRKKERKGKEKKEMGKEQRKRKEKKKDSSPGMFRSTSY